MSGADNLKGKGFDARTTDEQREIARQGGIASGKARRRRRACRTIARDLLSREPDDETVRDLMERYGVGEDEADYNTAIIAALIKRAS